MKKIFLSILILLTAQIAFSQSNKPVGPSSTQLLKSENITPETAQILAEIKKGKKSGDIQYKKYWESKLDEITKPNVIETKKMNFSSKVNNGQGANVDNLNITKVYDGAIRAHAISCERVNGEIYVAVGVYGGLTADTLKIYRSTNNGINFNLILTLFEGFQIGNNGLDIEAISRGDSTFAFISMDYNIGSTRSVAIFRIRQDGMIRGGSVAGSSSQSYSLSRVTSDNARYSTGTYIYYTMSHDSVASGTIYKTSNMFRIENPFDEYMVLKSCYQNPASGSFAYTFSGIDGSLLETDIAYVSTANDSDQVYIVTTGFRTTAFNDGSSVLIARSNSYGATAPALFSIGDLNHYKQKPRIASTGYLNNTILISTVRLYDNAGDDWDPYYFYSPNINWPVPNFTRDYIDNTSDTTVSSAVTGKARSNGSYILCYNNKLTMGTEESAKIMTGRFSGGLPGTFTLVNPAPFSGSRFYAQPDVAFRNVNNDSCLTLWSSHYGIYSYVTGGCSGAVTSVENPVSIVSDYSLLQNYPNPFNPNTVVSFQIPVPGFVSLKIYDVMGKEVAKLVNEFKQAGNYSIDFNAANFPSGVYYYRLEAGSFSAVKKMTLVK